MPNWKKVIVSGSNAALTSVIATAGFTGSLSGSALTATSSSYALTASYVNTLNQSVIITSSTAIGTSSLGPFENTLTLGARDAASEGGQIGFNAPGGTYTSASFIDNWQNKARILKGNNTTSTGLIAQWDIHTTQMQLPGYTAASSFPGTATANLAVDSGGNVITVSTTGGTVFPYTGNAVITGSLTATTGFIAPNTNGAMYLRGGDDVELWDINISNHLGVYGQQDPTVASIKLGSGGGIISGKSNNIGIGTINPTSASLTVNGNVWATSFTGSLQGTATTSSYVLQAVSASFAALAQTANTASYVVTAQTASYVLNTVSASFATSSSRAVSASFATTASYAIQALSASYAPSTPAFPYTGSAEITGSLGVTGSFNVQTYDGANYVEAIVISDNKRIINDTLGTGSFDADQRNLLDFSNNNSINWDSRRAFDDFGVASIRWGVVRSTYDSVESQSIDWNNRMLKIDNGPGSFTVNWGSGLLRDTGSKNSINWQDRIAIDNSSKDSINWQSRDLLDSSANSSVNWNSRYLYRSGVTVVDWSNTALNDVGGNASIDWNSRYGYDLSNNSSISWGSRDLIDSSNTSILNWDANGLNYKIEAFTYFKKILNIPYQELFSDVPIVTFNYEGEAIGGVIDNNIVLYDLVYLETDGIWYQVTQGTADCSKLLGICVDTSPNRETILLEGSLTVNDNSLVDSPYVQLIDHGLPIYIRDSNGTSMSTVIPTTTGQYVRILGHSYYQNVHDSQYWIMKFRPSNDWYVI